MTYLEKARQFQLEDPYKAVFDKYVNAINIFWSTDIQEYMNNGFPNLAEAINESEKRIDQIWGLKPLEDFRKEMFRFYKLHEKVFDLYQYGDEE